MIFQVDGNDYLIVVLSITFLLHLHFGFVASSFKKYSRPWARCLYIPIVLTIILRRVMEVDYAYVPYFIMVALSAQILGRHLGKSEFVKNIRRKEKDKDATT